MYPKSLSTAALSPPTSFAGGPIALGVLPKRAGGRGCKHNLSETLKAVISQRTCAQGLYYLIHHLGMKMYGLGTFM